MAGEETPHKYNLAAMQGTRAAHVAYPRAGYIIGGNPIPAISHPLKGELYGWLPLSDASGIILSILGIPNVILLYNVCFTFENLSNNIRILTPN